MTNNELLKLKNGDAVVITKDGKTLNGLVIHVEAPRHYKGITYYGYAYVHYMPDDINDISYPYGTNDYFSSVELELPINKSYIKKLLTTIIEKL